MSFVQNFPFFSIILSLVCAVVSFAANARWARRLSIFLLSASVVLQGSVLVYCAVHHVRYYYMMGHYPAPWGNELTAGILESFLAMLFAGVMLLSVLGGMRRILQDVPADKQKLYWVMVDLAHVALVALCYTNDIFTGYVFIEVLTIASCALLSVRRGGRALIASARYMIFALMGSGLFLIGVIFTYSVTGHLLFPQLHTAIADLWASGGHRFSVTMSLGLITAGGAPKNRQEGDNGGTGHQKRPVPLPPVDAGYLRPGHPGLLWHPVRRGVQGVYRVSHQGHLPGHRH